MSFSVDGEEIGRITYPEGGMWEHGEFETDWPGKEKKIMEDKL